MELYKIIATINNTADTFTLQYIPENFDGVKISQKFSFVNPIGYTPKFSIDTLRIIEDDKTTIDEVFDTYGLQSNVKFDIYKLNSTATGYDLLSYFAIDFESYEKFDVYSEFALKAISAIDDYNSLKNTEIQVPLNESVKLPNTQKFINYVSLKTNRFDKGTEDAYCFFCFDKNNDSKIYNNDTSMYSTLNVGYNTIKNADVYKFGENTESGTKTIYFTSSGSLTFNLDGGLGGYIKLIIKLYKNNFNTTIHTFYNQYVQNRNNVIIDLSATKKYIGGNYSENDVFFVAASVSEYITANLVFQITSGVFYFDIKRATIIPVINSENKYIKSVHTNDILSSIFKNNISIENTPFYNNLLLTSSKSLESAYGFANIKPNEFLRDFCMATGSIVNFKNDGSVSVKSMSSFFGSILNTLNAIEIFDFKDLTVKYSTELNFSSISVGQEIKEYDIYTYFIDWNKLLTFIQLNRNASENLELTTTKYRTDFSGILDYFYKRSQQKNTSKNENFIFKNFTDRGDNIYDYFTPRDILTNWKRFLSFAFQNFGLNTLTISSNGGTTDNLQISGVNQMDDLVLSETPRLLPIEYNFTCLIDDVDFSEKILKINDNGTDVYLFVINAETTDTLSEQKIQALKIQF